MPRLLTMWFVCLTDKFFTNPKLSLINIPALNYLLRSEIFVNDDGQLHAVHLILDFEPISRSFLDVGNSIRAGDHRLARIDVSRPDFLAPYDLPPGPSYPIGDTHRCPIVTRSTTWGGYLQRRHSFLFLPRTRDWQIQIWRRNNPCIGGRRESGRAFVCTDSCSSSNLHCRYIRRGGRNGSQDWSQFEGIDEEQE